MNIVDFIVLILTLSCTSIVAYISSKKSKKSANEFLSAEHSLNKWQTAFSITATDFGGSALVGTIGLCYMVGLSGMWWMLAGVPGFLFLGFFLAKQLNCSGFSTVPDYLGYRYSPSCRLLSSFMHIFSNIAMLSAQFTISSTILQTASGINTTSSLIITMILVILLTSGGLRSVVNTDATLFVIIVLSILFSIPVVLSYTGGLSNIIENTPSDFFSMNKLGFFEPLSWALMCMLGYSTNQNFVQRLVSAKDTKTARFSALFPAMFYIFIALALAIIGLCSRIILPDITDTNNVFPKLIMNFFPHIMIGFSVAGVFAATISTATSSVHGTVALFVNDIYKSIKKDATNKEVLIISRVSVVIFGTLGICISLYSQNIVKVLYTAGLFYSTSVFLPLLLGLKCKKISPRSGLLSIILSVTASILWETFIYKTIDVIGYIPSNVVGLITSLVSLIILSFINKEKMYTEVNTNGTDIEE